jgi:hypothetical protein
MHFLLLYAFLRVSTTKLQMEHITFQKSIKFYFIPGTVQKNWSILQSGRIPIDISNVSNQLPNDADEARVDRVL